MFQEGGVSLLPTQVLNVVMATSPGWQRMASPSRMNRKGRIQAVRRQAARPDRSEEGWKEGMAAGWHAARPKVAGIARR